MARRLHVPHVRPGDLPLGPAQARHARSVLRLADGAAVEVFDDAGRVAAGVLLLSGPHDAAVRVGRVEDVAEGTGLRWTVAAAVPKGERADWMVEKLSELGTAAFVPLAAARSVVLPEGRGKRERWVRIATESAKQSRRAGVMRIGELTAVADVVAQVAAASGVVPAGWYLSTAPGATPAAEAMRQALAAGAGELTLFVGPEGGWTGDEMAAFDRAGLTPVRLTDTVLRVETAAVAAAAVVGSLAAGWPAGE